MSESEKLQEDANIPAQNNDIANPLIPGEEPQNNNDGSEHIETNELRSDSGSEIYDKDFDAYDESPSYPGRPLFSRICGKLTKGSLRGAIISFVAFTIGVGCLTLPYVIKGVGFVPGLILLLVTVAANVLMLFLVLEVGLKKRNFNYNNIARETIGNFFLTVYDISCLINYAGVIMSYLTTSYEMVISFMKVMFDIDIYNYRVFMFIGVCVCINIPLCLISDVSRLNIASMIATFALSAIILTVVIETPFYIIQNVNDGKHVQWFKTPSMKYFDALASFMFAYSNQNTILLVTTELRKPTYKRGTKLINYSNIFILILYCCVGFGGYVSSLEDTPDIYIKRPNLRSFSKDYANAVTKVVLAICLCCIIPLKWNIFRESIKSLWKISSIPKKFDIPMTIISLIAFNVLVYFTNIITIINFIGGIITVIISFLVPILDYFYVFPEYRKTPKMIICYIILFVYTIVGTIASVKSVVEFIQSKIN